VLYRGIVPNAAARLFQSCQDRGVWSGVSPQSKRLAQEDGMNANLKRIPLAVGAFAIALAGFGVLPASAQNSPLPT
jgi:hypothetical protein